MRKKIGLGLNVLACDPIAWADILVYYNVKSFLIYTGQFKIVTLFTL